MSRKGRRKYDEHTACTRKKMHSNFWTVIQHCEQLSKVYPYANIYAYQCEYCEGMHITTGLMQENKLQRALKKNLDLMSDPEWWMKAPCSAINNKIELEMLLVSNLLYKES